MKKIILAALLFLCGCAGSVNLPARVGEELVNAQNTIIYPANISKPYYSFYLEPDIGRVEADMTSDIFMLEGIRFVMNLNVPEIVNSNFFTEVPVASARVSQDPVLSLDGTLKDIKDVERSWKLNVYEVETGSCAIVFTTYSSTFYAVCPSAFVPRLCGRMLKIARTVQVVTDEVLNAYTTKDTVVFKSSTIKLFESVAPINGRIEELFESDNAVGYEENHMGDIGQKQIETDDSDDGAIENVITQ